MNKKSLVLSLVVISLVILGFWYFGSSAPKQEAQVPASNTSANILQELDGVDVGSIENELQSVNADINSL